MTNNATANVLNALDLYGFKADEDCCYGKDVKNGYIIICYMGTSFKNITMESKSWEVSYGIPKGKASFCYCMRNDKKMSLNDIINKLQDIINDINEKYELREKIYAHLEKCGYEHDDYIYYKQAGDKYILVDLFSDMSCCAITQSDKILDSLFSLINFYKIDNKRELPIKEFLNTNI